MKIEYKVYLENAGDSKEVLSSLRPALEVILLLAMPVTSHCKLVSSIAFFGVYEKPSRRLVLTGSEKLGKGKGI